MGAVLLLDKDYALLVKRNVNFTGKKLQNRGADELILSHRRATSSVTAWYQVGTHPYIDCKSRF